MQLFPMPSWVAAAVSGAIIAALAATVVTANGRSDETAAAAVAAHEAGDCETALAEAGSSEPTFTHLLARNGSANMADLDALRDHCGTLLNARAAARDGAYVPALVGYAEYATDADVYDVTREITDLFSEITDQLGTSAACGAVPPLDLLAAARTERLRHAWADEHRYQRTSPALVTIGHSELFAPLREAVASDRPVALHECARTMYEAGDLDVAGPAVMALRDTYPDHELAQGGLIDEIRAAVIVDQIETARAGGHGELDPLEAVGTAPDGEVVLVLIARYELEILYTGPETGQVPVEWSGVSCGASGRTSLTLPPGEYEILVRASDDPDAVGRYGAWDLRDGTRYFACFEVS